MKIKILYISFVFIFLSLNSCRIKKSYVYYNKFCRFAIYIETFGQQDGTILFYLEENEKTRLLNFNDITFSHPSIVMLKDSNGVFAHANSINSIDNDFLLSIDISMAENSYILSNDSIIGRVMICDFHINNSFFTKGDTLILHPKVKQDVFYCIYGFRCCGVSDCSGLTIKTIDNMQVKEHIRSYDIIEAPPDKIIKYEIFGDRLYYITHFSIISP